MTKRWHHSFCHELRIQPQEHMVLSSDGEKRLKLCLIKTLDAFELYYHCVQVEEQLGLHWMLVMVSHIVPIYEGLYLHNITK